MRSYYTTQLQAQTTNNRCVFFCVLVLISKVINHFVGHTYTHPLKSTQNIYSEKNINILSNCIKVVKARPNY